FFFQAEDGIRDDLVTGVQTCALPISCPQKSASADSFRPSSANVPPSRGGKTCLSPLASPKSSASPSRSRSRIRSRFSSVNRVPRSEERRVGKECRYRASKTRETKKKR